MKKKKTSKTVPKRAAARPGRARAKPQPGKKTSARRSSRAATAPAEAVALDTGLERALAPELPASPPVDEVIVLETPEPRFASRVLPPEPDRPLPVSRRAIFFDVENASRPEHIARVIEHLEVDRTGRRTDFVAVGNWRVIGHDTARLLARHGAHLIHSAPSVGVRDWSDLQDRRRRRRVAGVCAARATCSRSSPSDRAFDAVGDVAASLGIRSGACPTRASRARRSRALPCGRRRPSPAPRAIAAVAGGAVRGAIVSRPAAPTPAAPESVVAVPVEPSPAPEVEPVVTVPSPPPPVRDHAAEHASQTAPRDELIALVHDLMQRSPARPLTLDTLANALKARGFSRPPGSPRLITRLRRIKEIALSRTGVITLVER